MIICPAQPFDIFSIMNIERQSFIPPIQEKKRVFEKRLKLFPEGFLVLADCSDEVILKNKTALVAGYLCAERWDSADFEIVKTSDIEPVVTEHRRSIERSDTQSGFDKLNHRNEKLVRKRFALGHNPFHTHKTNGSLLYISSFALLKDYRGKGLGEQFFVNAMAALCASLSGIKKIVLLVNSDWKAAQKIYKKWGFEEIRTLEGFFPTIQKKKFSDGIVMTADAARFKEVEFRASENDLSGIRI